MPKTNTILKVLSAVGVTLVILVSVLILLLEISPPENLYSLAALGICWAWLDWKLRYKVLLFPIAIFILPAIISCCLAVIDYSTGKPVLRTFGLMRGVVYDYETRLEFSSSGCIVSGMEFITNAPYNKTLRFLTQSFGYAKSAYQGTLPDPSGARSLILAKGKRISPGFPNMKIPSVNGSITIDVDSIDDIGLKILLIQQEVFFYDYSTDVIVIGSKSSEYSNRLYVMIRSMKNQFIRVR